MDMENNFFFFLFFCYFFLEQSFCDTCSNHPHLHKKQTAPLSSMFSDDLLTFFCTLSRRLDLLMICCFYHCTAHYVQIQSQLCMSHGSEHHQHADHPLHLIHFFWQSHQVHHSFSHKYLVDIVYIHIHLLLWYFWFRIHVYGASRECLHYTLTQEDIQIQKDKIDNVSWNWTHHLYLIATVWEHFVHCHHCHIDS